MPRHRCCYLVVGSAPILMAASSVAFGQNSPPMTPPEPDQTITVTANLQDTPAKTAPGSITVVTPAQIKSQFNGNAGQAIRERAGILVNSAGSPGRQTDVFIRGSAANQILVLIDGIKVSDPSAPGRGIDFANINLDQVERIEILKGPQSGLYGSDAMGGVINIITQSGRGVEAQATVSLEGHSLGGGTATGQVLGGGRRAHLGLTTSYDQLDGISAARAADGNKEKDGHKITTAHLKTGYDVTDNFSLLSVVRFAKTAVDLDFTGGPGGDDPNSQQRQQTISAKIEGSWLLLDDKWEVIPRVLATDIDREQDNPADTPDDPNTLNQRYRGRIEAAEMVSHHRWRSDCVATVGTRFEKESFRLDDKLDSDNSLPERFTETKSVFAQWYGVWKRLFGAINLRYDEHLTAGSFTTYRVAPGYRLTDQLTVKASYATGAKVPALFQLYSTFGDPNLKEEEISGYDLGMEYRNKTTSLYLTFFENHVRNQIDYFFETQKYANIGRAVAKGLEMDLQQQLSQDVSLTLAYTIQETENKDTGEALLRRPHHFASFALAITPGPVVFRPALRYVGPRQDATRALPAYQVTDIYGSYQITPQVRGYGKLTNAFDQEYEEIAGFGVPGRSGSLGVEATF